MWTFTEKWLAPVRKFLQREWKWPAAYFAATLLTLSRPEFLALPAGLVLLAAELADWFRTFGREINLSGILQATVLLTMWVAPALAYWGAGTAWYTGHIMPVAATVYWSLAAPGVALLNCMIRTPWLVPAARGTGFPGFKNLESLKPEHPTLTLLFLGLSAQLILPFSPQGLKQIFHLLSLLVFTGILYGIAAWPARRWWWVLGGSIYAGVLALQTTLFGGALMWILMMCLFAANGRVIPAGWRYGMATAGMAGLWLLLSFKYEYRKTLQQAERPAPAVGLFTRMLWQQITHPERIFSPTVLETAVNRFNQGYYTAQTMAWTPSREPFARGETIYEDLKGALLPRMLAPDKHRAGGYENMARFAGVSGRSYSMNIGIFGEAYVNFGIGGGIICLFGYGLALAALMRLSMRYLDPPWWPFLFLPALHVESDIGIVFNHLVKSGLIVLILVGLSNLLRRAPKTA